MIRPRDLLIGCVRLYRCVLSPAMRFLFGTSGACRFSPTCSCYAIEALQRHGARAGLRLILSRLTRCHPWGGSGHDPVPIPEGEPGALAPGRVSPSRCEGVRGII